MYNIPYLLEQYEASKNKQEMKYYRKLLNKAYLERTLTCHNAAPLSNEDINKLFKILFNK